MTSDPEPPRRRTFVDLSPLRASPAYARLWFGMTIAGVGTMMTQVAIALQVYELTQSTFAVGLVGGITLVPMIVAGLWGGTLIDAFDRRLVLIVSASVSWAGAAALAGFAWVETTNDHAPVWPLYLIATIVSVAGTIQGSTRFASIPRLVPGELVPAASALAAIGYGFQMTVGPALAGVLVAAAGFAWTYTVDVILFAFAFVGIVTLPKLPPLGDVVRPGWASVKAGLAFLRRAPNIRASFLVDIFAMTFGRLTVVFPAVAALVIGGGPVTVGILVAAGAVGAFLAGLFSGPVGQVRRHGLAVARSVMVYGGFVLLFGLTVLVVELLGVPVGEAFTEVFWPGLIAAAITQLGMGAADEVSAIFRRTMMLMAAPDHIRGRIQGVFIVVVQGGPRLGDLYVGVLASLVALWFPAVLGGLLIVGLTVLLLRVVTSFRDYDALDPKP